MSVPGIATDGAHGNITDIQGGRRATRSAATMHMTVPQDQQDEIQPISGDAASDIHGGRQARRSTATTDTTVQRADQQRETRPARPNVGGATSDMMTIRQTPSAPSSSGPPVSPSTPPRADHKWNEEALRQREEFHCQLRRPQEWAARQEAKQAGASQESVIGDGVNDTSHGDVTGGPSLDDVAYSAGEGHWRDEDEIRVARKDV